MSKQFESTPGGKYMKYTTRHLEGQLYKELKFVAAAKGWTVEHALNIAIRLGLGQMLLEEPNAT